MKFSLMTIIGVSAFLYASAAMAQEGAPCGNAGERVTIGNKTYVCSRSLGQAHKPNWDGRSKETTGARAMGQPEGMRARKGVFPGLSNDEYKKLQGSAKGRELIQQADSLRAQKAEAQKQFDRAARSGNAEQLKIANQNVDRINTNLNKMQGRAQHILVELR